MTPVARAIRQLLQGLPRLTLTTLPSPLLRSHRFARGLECAELWIKRDDLCAQPYGGNKVRKLELLLAQAKETGARGVLTYGALASNHALATAIYARQVGLSAHAVLVPQPSSPRIARTLHAHVGAGTVLHLSPDGPSASRVGRQVLEWEASRGNPLFEVPMGGSSPLGVLGFVGAALELAEQLVAIGAAPPDRLYVACGTMGTAIGLALGLRLAGLETRVEAVRVVPRAICSPATLEKRTKATVEYALAQLRAMGRDDAQLGALNLELRRPLLPQLRLNLREEFFGEGYGITTEAARDAVQRMLETEELMLETTYTGKALAALVTDARAGALSEARVLFWNTYHSRELPGVECALDLSTVPEAFQHYFVEYQP